MKVVKQKMNLKNVKAGGKGRYKQSDKTKLFHKALGSKGGGSSAAMKKKKK